MAKFVVGDVVTDGLRIGSVSDPFYWRDADDGTQNEPGENMIPVEWEDGTCGLRPASELEYA